ncbi:putative RNA-binding protein with PUA domain [Trachipleistophora hominis]|uniref:Putative RNA-binding protein with PUA domain n=1 Tax=Trachipleistophora hominis TaxID=72359 RepID=L7JUL2_TRAHO|nr:putative RNA-binding protein with PUA domain [Trachipleistophora hominis]
MSIFKNLKISTSNQTGGTQKKKIEKEIGQALPQDTYLHKCKNKIKLLSHNNSYIMFCYNDRWIFTLEYLRGCEQKELAYPSVWVDEGARQPLLRGSDIFVPGVYKYKEMIDREFVKNDVVVINIVGYGIFGLAVALIGYKEMSADSKGNGFKVLTVENDELDSKKLKNKF